MDQMSPPPPDSPDYEHPNGSTSLDKQNNAINVYLLLATPIDQFNLNDKETKGHSAEF